MFGLESIGVVSITDFAVLLLLAGLFVYFVGKFASSSRFDTLDNTDVLVEGLTFLWAVGILLGVVLIALKGVPVLPLAEHYLWAYAVILVLWVISLVFFNYMRRCKREQLVPALSAQLLHAAPVVLGVLVALCVILFLFAPVSIVGVQHRLLILVLTLPLFLVLATLYGFASWHVTPVMVHMPRGVIQGQLVRADKNETVIIKNGKLQRIANRHVLRIEYL